MHRNLLRIRLRAVDLKKKRPCKEHCAARRIALYEGRCEIEHPLLRVPPKRQGTKLRIHQAGKPIIERGFLLSRPKEEGESPRELVREPDIILIAERIISTCLRSLLPPIIVLRPLHEREKAPGRTQISLPAVKRKSPLFLIFPKYRRRAVRRAIVPHKDAKLCPLGELLGKETCKQLPEITLSVIGRQQDQHLLHYDSILLFPRPTLPLPAERPISQCA